MKRSASYGWIANGNVVISRVGTASSVEMLNGVVLLSGFAKSLTEKSAAENIARGVNNVKSVKNEIAVRP